MALWLQVLAGARFLVVLAVLLSPLWGFLLAPGIVARRRAYGTHAAYVHPAYRRPTRGEHRR